MSIELRRVASGNMIDPAIIQIPNDFDVRDMTPELEEHLHKLATSIAVHGVLEPLTVHLDKDTVILENGWCRLQAVALANDKMGAEIVTVPVLPSPKSFNEIDRVEAELLRNDGKPFTMLEQARRIKKLIAFGRTEVQLTERLGLSISAIKNLILLSSASSSVIEMVNAGQVSPSNAIEAIRKFGAKAGENLVKAVEMADGEGKKKATAKQLDVKRINWKIYGPKLREMLVTMCYSNDTKEVREANLTMAKELLVEIDQFEE